MVRLNLAVGDVVRSKEFDRNVALGGNVDKYVGSTVHNEDLQKAEFVVTHKSRYDSVGDRGEAHAEIIVIQKLHKNGKYNPKGMVVWFYTNGLISAVNYVDESQIKVIRRLKQSFA